MLRFPVQHFLGTNQSFTSGNWSKLCLDLGGSWGSWWPVWIFKKYFTPGDPRHHMPLWHIFWHIVWNILTIFLACYLAHMLVFYLECPLAFLLANLLAIRLPYIVFGVRARALADIPSDILAYFVDIFFRISLAFYLPHLCHSMRHMWLRPRRAHCDREFARPGRATAIGS